MNTTNTNKVSFLDASRERGRRYFEEQAAAELAAAPAKQRTEELAGEAFERLLTLAETRDSGQIRKIAGFLAACYNSDRYRFDISDLRVVDEKIRLDILNVLQAQTGFGPYLYNLPGVIDGEKRLDAVIKSWKPTRFATPDEQ